MKKFFALLLILDLSVAHAQCTLKDCQPPINQNCVDWCQEYRIIEKSTVDKLNKGTMEEITYNTGSAELASRIIKLNKNQRKFNTISDITSVEDKVDFANIQQRQITLTNLNFEKDSSIRKGIVEDIILIVQQEQLTHVRESCRPTGNACFTSNDLIAFKNNNMVNQITNRLRMSNWFLETITALKETATSTQTIILNKAQLKRRRTWEEMGEVSCRGQTEAGRDAEILIAETIVKLAKQMISK